jgi:DHA2 family multidrug resistance protein-like MFS transporter
MNDIASPSSNAHAHRAAPKATRRDWIGLAAIALPCLVYAMDLTVLNLALPAISADLKPTGSQLLWIVDIYGFLVAGFLITMGTLGDRIGRRRLLLIGAAAFALASAIAAFAHSAEMLIAMRALLGIAGATLAPSTLSLIRNMFHDERERQFAIAVWIASFSVGGAIGPLVGGVMLQFFWWGSVFLVALPVMALLLLLGSSLLPEYRDPHAGRIDLVSVAQSLVAVLGVIYALKQFAENGFAWGPASLLLAGLLVGARFVRRQGRLAYPLLDTQLFRQARFSAAIAAYGLSGLAMFGVYIFITQYLQLVLGLTPLQAGLATLPWSVAFVVGSLITPRLAQRYSPIAILVSGLVVAAPGFALLALVDGRYPLTVMVASTLIMSAGMAPVFTVGNEMIPHRRAARAGRRRGRDLRDQFRVERRTRYRGVRQPRDDALPARARRRATGERPRRYCRPGDRHARRRHGGGNDTAIVRRRCTARRSGGGLHGRAAVQRAGRRRDRAHCKRRRSADPAERRKTGKERRARRIGASPRRRSTLEVRVDALLADVGFGA